MKLDAEPSPPSRKSIVSREKRIYIRTRLLFIAINITVLRGDARKARKNQGTSEGDDVIHVCTGMTHIDDFAHCAFFCFV